MTLQEIHALCAAMPEAAQAPGAKEAIRTALIDCLYAIEFAATKADSVATHKSTDLSDNARSASEVSDKADSTEAKAQPLTFEQWWRDHGQFTRIAETEPADGEFEQALARAAWDAAHGIASSTKEGNDHA